MGIDLQVELQELISVLAGKDFQYALAGALALAVHGVPRATSDIDLLIRSEDLDAIKDAVASIGFTLPSLPMTFSDGMSVQRISKVEQGEALSLDLILVNADLEPIWTSRQQLATDQGTLWVISRDALIQMKLAAGRTRDIADVESLRELDR
jgi:hypothetical protein